LTSIGALIRAGHRGDARDLVDATARALLDLGLCDGDFRRRAAAVLDPTVDRSA